MGKSIRWKKVSYGTVEIIESDAGFMTGFRLYSIYINGQLRHSHRTLEAALAEFDSLY